MGLSLLTSSTPNFGNGDGVVLSFVALGIAVFGAAILLSANLRMLESGTRFVSPSLVATVRPPLAYLTRRPVRAGLATGSFALILAVLAYFAFLIPSLGFDPLRPADGYQVRVIALGGQSFRVPDSLQSSVGKAESLTTLAYVGPRNQEAGSSSSGWQTTSSQLYALTDQQLAHPPLTLGVRDPHYASELAVWQAIHDNPRLIVATVGGLGYVSLIGSGGVGRFQVMGILAGAILGGQGATGYIGSEHTFASLSTSGGGSTVLIKTAPDVDVAGFTRDLRLATFGQAVDVISSAELADLINEGNAWWLGFFTTLWQVSVVVGVLSLGILALRAAIERRRSIGVLRAVGYRPGQVLGGLLVEATVTATVGIVVGIGVGLAVSLAIFVASGVVHGRVDLSQVAVPAVLIYIAVLLVTVGPAIHASRLRPSEALRIVG